MGWTSLSLGLFLALAVYSYLLVRGPAVLVGEAAPGTDVGIDTDPGAPGTDYDADGFDNDKENWVATDIYDACPDNSNDPALPPDIDNNTSINIGDVIQFRGVIMTSLGDPGYDRRLDFNADMTVNIGDIIVAFLDHIMTSCTP